MATSTPCTPRRGLEQVYALSPMQEGMLFQCLMDPELPLYTEQGACLVEGPIEIPAMQAAWQQVAARHTALRTAFQWEGLRSPVQVVVRSIEDPFRSVDLAATRDPETAWQRIVAEDARTGFDLTMPPLWRVVLARLAPERYRLLWTMHHLIHDAWSTEILLVEVLALYRSRLEGLDAKLPQAIPYRSFVAWVRAQDWSAAEQAWSVATSAGVPVQFQTGDGALPKHASQEMWLTSEATRSLEAAGKRLRVTLNTLGHAAFAAALSLETGLAAPLFGTVFSGRSQYSDGAGPIAGILINTLPVCVECRPGAALDGWLEDCQRMLHNMLAWEHLPVRRLRHMRAPGSAGSLFEAALVFQNAFHPTPGDGNLRISGIRSRGHSNLPLTIRMTPSDRFCLEALYDLSRVPETTARRLLRRSVRFLELCAFFEGAEARPSRPVEELLAGMRAVGE
jgi:hypothetical protein